MLVAIINNNFLNSSQTDDQGFNIISGFYVEYLTLR